MMNTGEGRRLRIGDEVAIVEEGALPRITREMRR